VDRVGAARERIQAVRSFASQAREAGPPCARCHFRTLLGNCGNPAYAEQSFDPAKGEYSESYFTPVSTARAEDGWCGPEGLLFEPSTQIIEAAKGVGTGLRTALAYLTGGIIIAGLLAQLLGSSG
jgi:hypothetical protein